MESNTKPHDPQKLLQEEERRKSLGEQYNCEVPKDVGIKLSSAKSNRRETHKTSCMMMCRSAKNK